MKNFYKKEGTATRKRLCLLMLSFCILSSTHLFGQCPGIAAGYAIPGAGINNMATGAEAWNNPGNALTDNNNYATISNAALLIGGTVRQSNYLIVRNFGLNIPVNAQICGVQAEITSCSSLKMMAPKMPPYR